MSDLETLDERLAAVERAVTGGETDPLALEEGADVADRLKRFDERLDALEQQVADLEAAIQAVRGYVGNVRAVNEDVERRANAALARVESVERELDGDPVIDSFWTDDVDPAASEGWRDATGSFGDESDGSARPDSGGPNPGDERPESDESAEDDGELHAVVRRLGEAL